MNERFTTFVRTINAFGVRVGTVYTRFFSIDEIATSTVLKWFWGAMLLFFFLTFDRWISSGLTTVETAKRGAAVCWPFFQECYRWYFLDLLPSAYTQSIFYMALYGILLLIVFLMWRGNWALAHALTALLFVWKLFVIFGLSYLIAGPYDYYHLFLTAVLLFVPLKEYFLKLSFVFFYFMSVTVKFDSTWILGTYFSNLNLGLPLFPDVLIPFFTNAVIFMQVIGCWFLLSKRVILQRIALAYFLIFHLYSGIFVYYVYPTIALPPLLILFGPLYRHQTIPVSWKSVGGWTIILLISLFQLLGFITPSDRRLSLEGNRYGMFMFEANHQCVATVTTHSNIIYGEEGVTIPRAGSECNRFYCTTRRSITHTEQGTMAETTYESPYAWNRCDPYEWWSKLHLRCSISSTIEQVSFRFDHSINGGPFYRIADVPNICDVDYTPFKHNQWLIMPPEAEIIGYPAKNVYQ